MFDPLVRVARVDDASELVLLEQEARAALVDTRGGSRWLEEHPIVGDGWPTLLTRPDVSVLLAELDDVPTGFMVLVAGDDRIARIDQVWVTPLARGVGYGDTMMETALDTARSRACVRIEGEALPGDRETKNLYERAGITARLIVVSALL
ncbi:MAG: GNAT family N-acetyltransferase [Ilumatobacteraceae bacterium]